MAVTFWYAWLFNHTGGSILLLVIAHDVEGSIQYELGWIVMGVWLAVAIGLVVFDWKAWRGPAPPEATTVLSLRPKKHRRLLPSAHTLGLERNRCGRG